MFRNYLKVALRNLWKYKGFSIINIVSLTIGVVGCIVIGLFVYDEMQFDKSIPEGENIYRIYEEHYSPTAETKSASVPPMYATFLKQQYPEVDNTARILMTGDKYLVEVGDNKNYEEKGWFVDSTLFNVFSIEFVSGSATSSLDAPDAIVLSEELADRYFGKEDPINKIINVDKTDFVVKGVFVKPSHFHFDFNYLMCLPAAELPAERMLKWTWHQFFTYVKLKPGSDYLHLQEKFQSHIKQNIFPTLEPYGSSFLPFFQPLKDIHLKSADFIYDNAIRGNDSYAKALSIIAVFVLAIACFNFINLATARSLRRAKEIGVRKVAGADRKQLIVQFIGETILLSLFAVILATGITLFTIPQLNEFTGKSISFDLIQNPLIILLILAGGFVIGIIAGVYPALVLSGFKPIVVLKNLKVTSESSTHSWLRNGLVVVQFALSAFLIVSTLIVYNQTRYFNEKDLGFNKEQILHFQIRGDVAPNLEAFKSELKRSPDVINVTSGYGLPGDQYAGDRVMIAGKDGMKEFSSKVFIGDYDYVKTLGLRIIAGRDFSRERSTDEKHAFIINETAVKQFGYGTPDNAIGQPMWWNEWEPKDTLNPLKKGEVIGVVKDFHYTSLHEKLTPAMIHIYPAVAFKVAVKINTADIKNTITYINDTWNKFSPGYPLDYKFMDESFGRMYEKEQKLSTLLWIFTVMSILVACMGLFALAAFTAEQRTKEIGIRKVLGASVLNILALLSKHFVLLIILASTIAFPVAWWAMNDWLQNFQYRVNISIWIFIVAGVAAVVIGLITISFQTIRAAISNPVKNLRTE